MNKQFNKSFHWGEMKNEAEAMKDFIEHLIENIFIIIVLISALARIILPILVVLWLVKMITI